MTYDKYNCRSHQQQQQQQQQLIRTAIGTRYFLLSGSTGYVLIYINLQTLLLQRTASSSQEEDHESDLISRGPNTDGLPSTAMANSEYCDASNV